MPNSDEEQLFTLDGSRGKVGDVGDGPVAQPNDRFDAGFSPGLDSVMAASGANASPEVSPVAVPDTDDQVSVILSGRDDMAISADRALFDDLLRQRIAKVNQVSADVSRQLDELKQSS